ncbi:hypothetical protein H4R20_006730, partial [Coemansia guatemalensis]
NLRSKLAGNGSKDDPATDDAPAAPDGKLKYSMARFGANLSRRVGRNRPSGKSAGGVGSAHGADQHRSNAEEVAEAINRSGTDLVAKGADIHSGLEAGVSPTKQHMARRRRSVSSDSRPRDVATGTMVPLMVATSIGIGMSTSAMPPNKMNIDELVDQELERRDRPDDAPEGRQ